MLSTAVIIFREVLEIAMILGVILAATRGVSGRWPWIMAGFGAGIGGAGLVALFAQTISGAMEGMGQEFFNALILFTAALVIGWTAVWMKTHAGALVGELRQTGHQVQQGKLPLYSLAVIIGLSFLREGSEIVLFVYGMTLSGQETASIVLGCTIGMALGLLLGTLLYFGLLRLPARRMLAVTGWLLMLLVAGLAAQGTGYLSAAGWFPHLSTPVWDTSWLLSESSVPGKALHSLVGYMARPTPIELIVYVATLTILLAVLRRISAPQKA